MDSIRLEQELKKNGEIVVYKLQEWAERAGKKNFFYYGEEDKYLTFEEFNKLTNSIANRLQSMGVKKGDRISLLLMNPLVTSLAMFGIWKAGAIFCPINFNYKGRLLSYQINDTKPKLLITESGLEPEINNIKEKIFELPVIVHEPKEGDHDYVSANTGLNLDKKFSRLRFEDLLKGETSDLSGYGQTESGAGFVGIIDEFGDEEGTPKELYKGLPKEEFKKRAENLGLSIIPGDAEIEKGYMGNASILLEAVILNENDKILGPYEHGQLAFRSRLPFFLFNEYFNKPEATAETYRNQWLHTGDAAYKDKDGIYYFVDRMGGFIRTRGENISSYQIEDIINSHPKVSVCAAFPVPSDEGLEDDCVVFITVIQGEKLEEPEIREWIKSEMPKFMWPKHFRFIDVMPQTPTYKIEKYKLKKLFLNEQ